MTTSTGPAVHFDPSDAQRRLYAQWERAGYFQPRQGAADGARAFTMVLPPPNVTGALHMGHGLNATLQDILARYRRMDGDRVLWIPGADHASIAVHWVLERALAREGLSRQSLGREAFLARAWAFKAETEQRIQNQLRQLGVSCDFSRWTFTLDAGPSAAVTEAFVRLWEDGLIYRAERLVNWDCVSQTTLSDLEVVRKEGVAGELALIGYPLADGDGELVVATTRPETVLADTAIAVHPDDPRYRHVHGGAVRHPLDGRVLPVVTDAELVDPTFGTGVVKLTPAHDFADYQAGKRHQLPVIRLFARDGTLTEAGGDLAGLDIPRARDEVLRRLAACNRLRERRPHRFTQAVSERSGAVVEPMLSWQWFVRTRPLAAPARAAVEQEICELVPASWRSTYFAWLHDIQDWCVSRQLWWGHRIPAWHCRGCRAPIVARQAPERCGHCGCRELDAEEDVLDTWFSSALWPFSTLGWPQRGPDLATFYPTAVLSTSFDIIFFWVARMMMMGHYFTGRPPFRRVFFHPLVRDAEGAKMSKTKGNVVDPLAASEHLGCDAFRLTIASLTHHGRDLRWDEQRAEGYRKFVNKLWQAFRFVDSKLAASDLPWDARAARPPLGALDVWILGRLRLAIGTVRAAWDGFRFGDGAHALQRWVWEDLCDWYLEASKVQLASCDAAQVATRRTLLTVLETTCRLIHPVMPFVSDEIYRQLPGSQGSVMVAPYPTEAAVDALLEPRDAGEQAAVSRLFEVIIALRRVRATYGVPPRLPVTFFVADVGGRELMPDAADTRMLAAQAAVVAHLAQAERRPWTQALPPTSALEVVGDWQVVVPLADLIDVAAVRLRLNGDIERLGRTQARIRESLERADFLARAPADVVADKRRDADQLAGQVAVLAAALARLG